MAGSLSDTRLKAPDGACPGAPAFRRGTMPQRLRVQKNLPTPPPVCSNMVHGTRPNITRACTQPSCRRVHRHRGRSKQQLELTTGWRPSLRSSPTPASSPEACRVAGMHRSGVYALRTRDPVFAAAWTAAQTLARPVVADGLLERFYYRDRRTLLPRRGAGGRTPSL